MWGGGQGAVRQAAEPGVPHRAEEQMLAGAEDEMRLREKMIGPGR